MGFVSGTAVTVDADFTKYYYEPEIVNLQRAGVNFTNLHIGVIDEHIAYLRGERGVADPSTISNVSDHKPLLVAMLLAKIFRGAGNDETAARYEEQASALRTRLPLSFTGGDVDARGRGLPVLVQPGVGSFFPRAGAKRGTQVAAAEIENFEDFVVEGK